MPDDKRLNTDQFHQALLGRSRMRRRSLKGTRDVEAATSSRRRNDLAPELEYRMVSPASLTVSPHRTRRTTAEQLARVCDSIRAFGISRPILTDGEGEVVDGHIVLEAALKLRLEAVPAIVCTHLTSTEVRQLRLALNRIAEKGEWDLDALKVEFETLIELDADIEITGFSKAEGDIILLSTEPTDDGVEEPDGDTEPVSQLGDVWLAGPNRIVCGDARFLETYRMCLSGEVHAVVADFPYNVPIGGNVSGLGKAKHKEFVMASGEMSREEFATFLEVTFATILSFLAKSAVVFAFIDWRSVDQMYAAGQRAGLKLINLIVWSKGSGAMGSLYRSAHELIVLFCNGDRPRVNNVKLGKSGRDRTNVWEAAGANRRGSSANQMLQHHSTPKPVELCIDTILDVTNRGETVLDPFLGSGTTLIAAHRCRRVCVGVELDPQYVDVCLRRWHDETGQDAVLLQTGETFSTVAHKRAAQVAIVQESNDG